MTDSSIIQQARHALAKWRALYTDPNWQALERPDGLIAVADSEQVTVADAVAPEDARLIVGTAGNPDLLDAIDGMLAGVQHWATFASVPARVKEWADSIAAAIVAADERMSA